ncbi:MAG TPA: DUF721 domain-containing protein [Gaiellaceae bacterium]|nr:DUF721 domain-containing protein [Gaiellaceae bacterium]
MRRLGDDARRLLASSGVPDPGPLDAIAAVWPAAVGSAIARSAWPRRIARDGTLHVATVSSTWAFELDRLGPEMLERLATALEGTAGAAVPTSLRFAPGPVPEPAPEPGEQPPVELAADPQSREEGIAVASSIDDEELRGLVARAAAASLAWSRSRS